MSERESLFGFEKLRPLADEVFKTEAITFDDLEARVMLSERDRLRKALQRIQEWDCLNPPDARLCADHPWLRRLVDDALAGRDVS